MALEIEIKLRVRSHDPVRQQLTALGATHLSIGLETNHILDKPDGSLRQAGYGARVRHVAYASGEAPTITLTVKGPTQGGEMKTREEHEVSVGDAASAIDALRLLGLVVILEYEKRRESWTLGDCRVELDTPPHIGAFVEIEGPSEASVRRVQAQLGLAELAHVKRSYPRILRDYCDDHGIADYRLPLP